MGAASGAFGSRHAQKLALKTSKLSTTTLELYYVPHSPPCRAVLLTIKALNLTVTLRKLDLFQRAEHKQVWFLKVNPTHTVPALDDDGFTLWESRAIMGYLVQKYGRDDALYPKEPHKRATVDKMLYFDIGKLYQSILDYWVPQITSSVPPDSRRAGVLQENLECLDDLLKEGKYLSGNQLTIADFSLVASVTTLDTYDFDYSSFTNIARWIDDLRTELPYFKECITNNIEITKLWVKSITRK